MMINGKKTICAAVVLVMAVSTGARAEDPYEIQWKAQIGTSVLDVSKSVVVDGFGNAYITGRTGGDMGGSNAGQDDAFVSKFDAGGNVCWTSQIGTSAYDESHSIAIDAFGNTYISGGTPGDLSGSNAGPRDAFLSKFDSDGAHVWSTQIGTSADDKSFSVAVDVSGDVYITGSTRGDLGGSNVGNRDVFLVKYNSGGNELWKRQIGTVDYDTARSMAVDASGNVYLTGWTEGDFGGSSAGRQDAFISKFDSGGNVLWTTQMGTSSGDHGYSVAVDASGNAYITGITAGDLGAPNAGQYDAFLGKFDSDGNHLWTSQFGTDTRDEGRSVAVDASGNVYISGYTDGDLGGRNAGTWGNDAFLRKFDSGGNELWTTQIGTSSDDASTSVAVDAWGNVYISGHTQGDFGGPNAGSYDVFLVKYEVPEPATLSLLALGGLAVVRRRRRRLETTKLA